MTTPQWTPAKASDPDPSTSHLPRGTGYGASFEGLAPLLTMLNSCAPGVAVVNIDNGYGAGHLAAQIAAPF